MISVFLSHKHTDKTVARRLARELSAHGITAWLDEENLRPGAQLTATLRTHIEAADVVLVVASAAAARSKWVLLEMEHARKHDKRIVPFFIEPVARHKRFRDHLGIDATFLPGFAGSVRDFMRDVLETAGRDLPEPDPRTLEASLRALAREEPNVAPLVDGCLDGEGLHQEQMPAVYQAGFHPVDYALNALLSLKPTERIACHVAYGFAGAGAGADGMRRWIELSGNGGGPLNTAVGCRLDPSLIGTAIRLLESCAAPNNHALYQFIHHNAEQLDPGQRRSALRLVTWPTRGPGELGDVLGGVAMRHFPEAIELQQMWSRWIRDGCFDGDPFGPADLARYFVSAKEERLRGWDPIHETLRQHVRRYLRSGDRQKVHTALDHLRANADAMTPALPALLREAEGVTGTAEWNDWRERDPEVAEEARWHLVTQVNEASGGRDWNAAWEKAEKMLAFEKERRRVLANDRKRDGDSGP